MKLIKAREVVVYQNKDRRVNVDGEAIKLGTKLKIKVHPSSLKVIVP